MIDQVPFLAQQTSPFLAANLPWLVAGAIVLLGLVVYGGGDLLRLSIGRIRAIASVCFSESLRRRVLWLTPLAVLGVILVSQFQRPFDEQDAIRQITKFCIFAAGILITLSSVILACTNLPREIDNRVIYTIVTKPTSRLEILIGKIAGFAGVSAAILLIMGIFTFGYLKIHEWRVLQQVDARLQAGGLDPAVEQTLKFYKQNGLLDARQYAASRVVQVFPEYPAENDPVRYISNVGEQEVLIPFIVPAEVDPASLQGMAISIHIPWKSTRPLTTEEQQQVASLAEMAGVKVQLSPTPMGPGEAPAIDFAKLYPVFLRLGFNTANLMGSIGSNVINNDLPVVAVDSSGKKAVEVPITAQVAQQLASARKIYLKIAGGSPATRYEIDPKGMRLIFVQADGTTIPVASSSWSDETPGGMLFAGRANQNGQQVNGDEKGNGSVGVFSFRNVDVPLGSAGTATFEFRTIVERTNIDDSAEVLPTITDIRVVNKKTGMVSEPVILPVESRRLSHFTVPAEYVRGGSFDVLARTLSPNQWIGLRAGTIRVAGDDRGFGLNLAKSLLILWMFSILVITVAIFCSTFLSWPIAFVLTLLILLGHWGVLQLGDLASPGVGRQIVGDLFAGAAPAVAETLNRSVEGLGQLLRLTSSVLPDVSKFAAMTDMEQGVSISAHRIGEALKVLAMFGLPILSLGYVFFRNKEVAP